MTKKKKPITTGGWLKEQAKGICARIDFALTENHVEAKKFRLLISANVIRTICDITIITAGQTINTTAPLIEGFNPFDNKSYLDKTEKLIMKKYGFTSVVKLPNVRQYEFSFWICIKVQAGKMFSLQKRTHIFVSSFFILFTFSSYIFVNHNTCSNPCI